MHAGKRPTCGFLQLYLRLQDRLQQLPLPPDLPLVEHDLLLVVLDGLLHRLEDLLGGRGQPLVDDRPQQLDGGHDAGGHPQKVAGGGTLVGGETALGYAMFPTSQGDAR